VRLRIVNCPGPERRAVGRRGGRNAPLAVRDLATRKLRFDDLGPTWTKLLFPSGLRLDSSPDPTGLLRILEPLVHGRTKANREHTCRFTRQVLDRLAGRYGLAVLDEAFLDDMDSYHRPRAPCAADGPVRRVAAASVIALNRIICPPFLQLCETYGYVLRLSDVGGVAS